MGDREGWTFDMRPCPHCRTMITQTASWCRKCGGDVEPAVRDEDEDAGAVQRMMLPIGRPASAIAAGYLGLFSVLPFFGIFAIIFGVVALRTLNRNPRLSGRGRAIFGLVMGTLTTLLYVLPILVFIIHAVRSR